MKTLEISMSVYHPSINSADSNTTVGQHEPSGPVKLPGTKNCKGNIPKIQAKFTKLYSKSHNIQPERFLSQDYT